MQHSMDSVCNHDTEAALEGTKATAASRVMQWLHHLCGMPMACNLHQAHANCANWPGALMRLTAELACAHAAMQPDLERCCTQRQSLGDAAATALAETATQP